MIMCSEYIQRVIIFINLARSFLLDNEINFSEVH